MLPIRNSTKSIFHQARPFLEGKAINRCCHLFVLSSAQPFPLIRKPSHNLHPRLCTPTPTAHDEKASKEATLLAKLKHPNIVGFWESFFHGASRDVLCIVMDYADGGDLSSCLSRRNGRLIDEEIVLDWFVQTTLALKHIHDRKILHRDLKTQNIFLTRSRVVKLGDFGIAKVLGSTFDLARTAIGTPYYMSPEICQEKRYNHKSDMWSLGYSSGVRSLVAQLLKKDPHARPSTGAVLRRPLMKDKIGRFLNKAQAISQSPPPPPLPLGPHPPRRTLCPVRPPPLIAGRSTVPVSATRDQRALRPGAVARTSTPGGEHGRWPAREDGVAARLPKEKRQQAWRKNGEKCGPQKRKRPTSGGGGPRLCRERRRYVVGALSACSAAKERGQLAAVALNIAKPSSAGSRFAKPNRQSSAEDAASRARRDSRQKLAAEQRELDSKRAQDRAEVARAALGIGGGRGPSPPPHRRGSPYDGDAKAQRPRRPSARAVSPAEEEGPDVRDACGGVAGAREERVIQRLQNMCGGGSASPAGGGLEGPTKPKRLDGEAQAKRRGEMGAGLRSEGVLGAAKYGVEEMSAALELVRRRRAARAVFGIGSPDKDAEEDVQSNLEVKSSRSSRDRSRPGKEVTTPCRESGERPAVPREPSAETGNTPTPSLESKQATNRHHDRDGNRGTATAPADDKGGAGCDGEINQAENAGDYRRRLGQAQRETVPETVAEIVPRQTDRKGSSDAVGGDAVPAPENERKAGGVCRGEAASMDGRGQEAKSIVQGPGSDVPMEFVDAEGGCGDGGVRSKVNLGVDDGWFQTFEAKMGAIKKQVEQIKSPPTSTPRRRDGDQADYVGSSRPDPTAAAKSHRDFETPPPHRYPIRQQRAPRGIHNDGQGDHDDDDKASVGSAGVLRRSDSSFSQQTARLHAVAAAVEAAAEVLAAIPATATSEDNQTPEVRRCRSDGDLRVDQGDRLCPPTSDEAGDEEAGKPVEGVGGSGSGAARPSRLGGPGGVKVAMTPAQRGSGGRAARQPPVSSRSERKPPSTRGPRHAAALAAELGRYSDNRPWAKARSGVRAPSGNDDDEEGGGHEAHPPSAEERVQALRATRDRERGKLRALIAEKRRRSSIEKAKAAAGGEASPQGAAPRGDEPEPDEPLLPRQEWSSPRDMAAAGVGGRRPADRATGPPASEPRGGRCRGTPLHRVACPKGGARSGSVNASTRRRRRPGSDYNDDSSNQEGELRAGARREPAKRQQSLRDFIAESRRNQRVRRSVGRDDEDEDEDDDGDGFSVLVPSGPGRRRGEGRPTDHDALATGGEEKGTGEVVGFDDAVVAVVPARRNIGLDFEEEGRVWEAEEGGRGAGAEAAGGAGVFSGGGGSAAEVGRGGAEEQTRGEEESVASRGSSKSSSSSTLWNWEHSPVGEAVGSMEGVHPGLATYNSQRTAAAVVGGGDGGGRAGQEEYARMLELMQQEVLELGDGASTDSGWGESSSNSGEEKSSGSESKQRPSGGDDEEQRTGGGCGGGGGEKRSHNEDGVSSNNPSRVVSGPELAVFLFQGGVKGGNPNGSGLEAKDDHGSSGAANFLSPGAPSCGSRDSSVLAYSGSGLQGLAVGGGVSTVEGLRSAACRRGEVPLEADEVLSREEACCGDSIGKVPVATDVTPLRDTREDLGTKSSSLSGELRGVDFILGKSTTRGAPP
ncbi:unnamed protein product [Ectocarpus sp. CCAP 1310/34]|nr:unnamed protein product [Ectocarpus sp. CCAP 1310/34]